MELFTIHKTEAGESKSSEDGGPGEGQGYEESSSKALAAKSLRDLLTFET